MKRSLLSILTALGMLMLVLDAKTALNGAKEGIELCLMTVIPSLFPFFVLSILLTSSLIGQRIKLLRPLGKACRMTPGTESVLAVGLLGGYPTGAQAVSQIYQSGRISRKQAQRLLGFCSNAGPAFIFGICGSLFPEKWIPWLLWALHILSALAVGAILPGQPDSEAKPAKSADISLPQALDRALKTIARVCGWVVLFRIVLAFLNKWLLWRIQPEWSVFLSGVLEMTNGCCQLKVIENAGLRFLLASVFLSFGGICVTMQTASVTGKLGLGCYLRGKLLQTGISALLAVGIQAFLFPAGSRLPGNPMVFLIPAAIFMPILMIYEKKSSIPERSLV